jgi:hypothetical protein
MSQYTLALCFFIVILAMAGTVLVLTIIYFFRQTSNRARVTASGTGLAEETGQPAAGKTIVKPSRPEQPVRKSRFFWNRKKDSRPAKKEKVYPAVSNQEGVTEAKRSPVFTTRPEQPVKKSAGFWSRFKVGGKKKLTKEPPSVNTTVYDAAVVAATVSDAALVSTPVKKAEASPRPAPGVKTEPALKPVTSVAAGAAPKFILPKKPVPAADVNIDLPPVSVKNMMPGTPLKSDTKAIPPPIPSPVAVKSTPIAANTGAIDKNKVELVKPAVKENKPEMGNKDVKQPEKPAAEKAPAPPAVKPPPSTAPAPPEAKKSNDFSSLGDLSKMFAKEVVDDSEATKLAKNMKDVEINDLLKSGQDIANLLKRH